MKIENKVNHSNEKKSLTGHLPLIQRQAMMGYEIKGDVVMEILKVEGKQAYVRFPNGLTVWVDKAMLKQFGIRASDIKVGAKFPA